MKIYWIFLGLSLLLCVWCGNKYQLVRVHDHYETKAYWIQAIPFFAVVIFFCGLRSGIADTGTYIAMFNDYPSRISAIVWDDVTKDKGFYLISVLYKQFISEDFHGWLFLIALISGIATMVALKKYSSTFGMSCFLFIATTQFTYLVNGMRQYICIAFMFACVGLIAERKFWRYIITVLLLSTIHASVLIFIPVYFLVKVRPWSKWMFWMLVVTAIVGLNFDKVFSVFGNFLEETQYAGYVSYISEQGVGSNVIRLAIAAIPCILAFLGREIVEEQGNEIIRISVNMSVINLCLYFIATFSSGMAVGRITAFFDIFNLLLLPWLLKYIFTKASSMLLSFLCVIFYSAYFYYQMVITWNLGYESDILHIFC